eukprot:jgi/Tetstr1/425515/TSEL_001526.t1
MTDGDPTTCACFSFRCQNTPELHVSNTTSSTTYNMSPCLRTGAASAANAIGAPLSHIRYQGGWATNSDVVQDYIDPNVLPSPGAWFFFGHIAPLRHFQVQQDSAAVAFPCDDGPGYWLYNLQSGRVIRSVHVAFLEGIPAHAPPPSTPADVPPCAHLAGPSQDAARFPSPFAAAAATATPVFSRPTKRPAPPASPASDWHELDASPVPPAVAPGQYPPASRIPVPDTIKQALAGKYHKEWRASIVSELRSLRARNTFAYACLPVGRHAIGNKWVFKVKANSDGSVNRFKARLVAQGFSQQAGVDYHATFSPVVKLSTLRTCLAVAAARGMHIHQIDIETAFLNASVKEEIYMRQPKGAEDGTDNVLRLLKSIYGLKQASREWYELIHKTLTGLGLARSNSDTSMYSMNHPRYGICIVLVYVDDILVVSDSVEWIRSAKSAIDTSARMLFMAAAAICCAPRLGSLFDGAGMMPPRAPVALASSGVQPASSQ